MSNNRKKNAAAVALGRLGASKGGRARANALSAKERKAIARAGGLERARRARERAVTELRKHPAVRAAEFNRATISTAN